MPDPEEPQLAHEEALPAPDGPQPAHDLDRPESADVAPGDLEAVIEDGEDLGEVAGGGEITDLGGGSGSS